MKQFLNDLLIKLLLHTLSLLCLVSSSVEESALLDYTTKLQKSTLHFKTLDTRLASLEAASLEVSRSIGTAVEDHLETGHIFNFSFSVYSTLPSKCSSGSLMFSGSRFSGLEVSQDCSGDTLHSKVVSLEDTAIRGAGFKLYTAPAQLLHNSYTLRAVSPSPRSIKTTVRLVEIVQIVIWR